MFLAEVKQIQMFISVLQ